MQSKREISLLLALLFMIMSLFGRGDVSVRLYSAGTVPPVVQDRMIFSREIAIPIKKYFIRSYTVVIQSGRHPCGYCRDGTTTGPDDMIQ